MQKTCNNHWCQQSFEITDDDLVFYEKVSPVFNGKRELIPPPTLCPECRQQRRTAVTNQLNLYERKCDLTGSSIISNVHPDAPYKVYRQHDWHSDAWSALDMGRDYDFNHSFFEQWDDLCHSVPRPSLFVGYEFDENAAYTNHAGKNKDCYLIFDSDENRGCYYSYSLNSCQNCVDCFRVRRSELCYECIDCVRCYGSMYLQDCDNCHSSMFLKNCTGCSDCLMCSNVKNKQYCIENKQVTPEEYKRVRSLLSARSAIAQARMRFDALKLEFPQKYMHGMQNETVLGDYLVECKNAFQCFDSEHLWDCRYVFQGFMPLKSCMDIQECGDGELLYECAVTGYGAHASLFSHHTLASFSNLLYCSLCPHSKDCFGCIGMRRKQYCILNKQYTKEEYGVLVPRIIDHMRSTKEWGEFFPITSSTYAYNETLAQDYFPLPKEEVLARGWRWLDDTSKRDQYLGPVVELPEMIADTNDEMCKKILSCTSSAKQYKIIPQELAFYRSMNIPIPTKAFMTRHHDRMQQRNPRTLHHRTCAKCNDPIQTTYSPERPEIVYCESCYLQAVY